MFMYWKVLRSDLSRISNLNIWARQQEKWLVFRAEKAAANIFDESLWSLDATN